MSQTSTIEQTGKCVFPNCSSNAARGSKLCIGHRKHSDFETVKEQKPVNKVSSTQQKINEQYKKLKKVFLLTHKTCEVKLSPECTGKAEGIHHRQGRGKTEMLKIESWVSCCNVCNQRIEANHFEASQAGMKISRHIKQNI